MENKQERMEKLKAEVLQIKNEILSMNDKLPIQIEILHFLIEIDEYLKLDILDKQKMENYSFGIFRLVTENYALEKSILGQDLLSIQKNMRRLLRDFY
jgi:hypothetical protein